MQIMVWRMSLWIECLAQGRLRHSGSIDRVFDYDLYGKTWACLLCIFVPPPTSLVKLLTWAFFSGPCHCSYLFVPWLAFRVHFADDLNQKTLFVVL